MTGFDVLVVLVGYILAVLTAGTVAYLWGRDRGRKTSTWTAFQEGHRQGYYDGRRDQADRMQDRVQSRLAEIAAEGVAYDRDDPVTGEPVPDSVDGYQVGGRP